MQISFEHRASFVFSLSLFLSVKGGEGIVCRKNDIFGTKDDKTREEVTGRQRFQVVEIFDELIVGGRYTSLRSLTMDRLLLEKILSPDKKSRRPVFFPPSRDLLSFITYIRVYRSHSFISGIHCGNAIHLPDIL